MEREFNEELCDLFIERCIQLAQHSNCTKRHFGAIVVPTSYLYITEVESPSLDIDKYIIGYGYNHAINTPPLENCQCIREKITSGVHLEACYAIHAEQMAMMDALAKLAAGISGKMSSFLAAPLMGCSVVSAVADVETGEHLVKNAPGFYCTLCARPAKWLGLDGGLGSCVDGLYYLTAQEMFESSYRFAAEKETVSYDRPG